MPRSVTRSKVKAMSCLAMLVAITKYLTSPALAPRTGRENQKQHNHKMRTLNVAFSLSPWMFWVVFGLFSFCFSLFFLLTGLCVQMALGPKRWLWQPDKISAPSIALASSRLWLWLSLSAGSLARSLGMQISDCRCQGPGC